MGRDEYIIGESIRDVSSAIPSLRGAPLGLEVPEELGAVLESVGARICVSRGEGFVVKGRC